MRAITRLSKQRLSAATHRVAPLAVGRRNFADDFTPADKNYRSIQDIQSQLQGIVDAKPDMYGGLDKEGIQYEQFSALVEEACPTIGERERRSLFTSMDVSGDGWIQGEELFSDVVLRVIRTRSESQGELHPVQGSYASLPRPPFVHDPKQMAVVNTLADIYDECVGDWEVGVVRYTARAPQPKVAKAKTGGWGGFFSGGKKADKAVKPAAATYKAPEYEARKGLYIVGTSGSGKTALLNVLFRSLPEGFPVVRLHWHEFCRDGFRYMNTASSRKQKGRSAFEIMADEIVGHCRVFLLDEMNITSISEGVLVKELFRALWLRGVTVITTSNYRIDQLYYQGFNRQAIEDFLPEFMERCTQVDMSADCDYRTVGVETSGNFLVGLTDGHIAENHKKFKDAAGEYEENQELPIPHEKRTIAIPFVNHEEGVARFTFDDLCRKPLGRSDYSLIATNFQTVFVDNIPKLTDNDQIEFKRFVSLIDMMYDKKVNLHTLSEVPCREIYGNTEDLHLDEQFAWRRCQSMLTEMQSTKYQNMAWLMRRHLVQDSATSL